nr:Chain B, microcin J25 [Escherichia coli]
VGIGTPISFYG